MDDEKITKIDKVKFGVGILFSLLIISASGWLFYENSNKKLGIRNEELVNTQKVPVPTQVPLINIDYKNSDVLILNASGKSGLAKTYQDKLINLGYKKITTGNYNKKISGNILESPTDIGHDINLDNYEFVKSENIRVILGK